jgi:hypothetical protein
LCLFAYSDVQHMLCCVFSFSFDCLCFVPCVHNVVSFDMRFYCYHRVDTSAGGL